MFPSKDENSVLTLWLDNQGIVRDVDGPCETLFDYRRGELVARHVSMLVPELAELDLAPDGEPNATLRFHSRIGVRFQARKRCGERFLCDLFLNRSYSTESPRLRLLLRRAGHKALS